jgi:RecA-family ATPase
MTDDALNVDSEEAARERYLARKEKREQQQQTGASSEGADSQEAETRLHEHIKPARAVFNGRRPGSGWPAPKWLLESHVYQGGALVEREGVMRAGIMGLLVAPGGVGKTAALVQLAVAVATGRDWLGYHVAQTGKVLLALGEEDADEIGRRLDGAAGAIGLNDSECEALLDRIETLPAYGIDAAFLSSLKGGELFPSPEYKALQKHMAANGPWSLIVLDPLGMFAGLKDENDNAGMNVLVRLIRQLTQLPGNPTVVLAHHTNKGAIFGEHSQASSRGASALPDGVRWMASLERWRVEGDERNLVQLKVHKTNGSLLATVKLIHIAERGQPRVLPVAEFRELEQKARLNQIRREEEDKLFRAEIRDKLKKERKATGDFYSDDNEGDPYE